MDKRRKELVDKLKRNKFKKEDTSNRMFSDNVYYKLIKNKLRYEVDVDNSDYTLSLVTKDDSIHLKKFSGFKAMSRSIEKATINY
jgi:hypothetical protein